MDPLKYYNFKNSLELHETLGGNYYNFRAIFNGGFVSGFYSYDFNAIVEPIFGDPLTAEEKSDITGVLKKEVERLREREDLRIKKEREDKEKERL